MQDEQMEPKGVADVAINAASGARVAARDYYELTLRLRGQCSTCALRLVTCMMTGREHPGSPADDTG